LQECGDREEYQMVRSVLSRIGFILLVILKGIAWVVLTVLKFVLEIIKIILLLFGLVMRLFLVFVRAGTS